MGVFVPGAIIDAVETASHFGIGADRAVNYQCDSEGTALNYEVVSEAISSVRCSAQLSADWKKRIDDDYKSVEAASTSRVFEADDDRSDCDDAVHDTYVSKSYVNFMSW